MSGILSNKIDVSKFLAQLSNPDEDFAVIELDKLIKMLEKPPHEIFVTPNCDEWFLENILSRVYSKKIDLIEASYRSIVLLSQYYNVDKIRIIFRRILDMSQENGDIRPQLLSLLKEILTNHSFYESQRNEEIFTYFFGECMRSMVIQLDDNLTFTLELLTSLIENLGSLATEKQLNELLDKILYYLKPERVKEIKPQMRSLSNLTKEWSRYASQSSIDKLVEYLLNDQNKSSPITLSMLTAIIMTIQKPLEKFFDQLYKLFYENSQIDTEMKQQETGNEEEDIASPEIADSDSIKRIQGSVEALANLVQAFPEQSTSEIDNLFNIFFTHIDYNIVESIGSIDEDSDEGIMLEIDSDMEDSDNGFVFDGENGFDDEESWKIRKSAIRLGTTLISVFPKVFFEKFQIDENSHHFTVALGDTDPGVKKDILDLLTMIVKTYGTKISLLYDWVKIVCNSVKSTDQNCINYLLTISEIAKTIDISGLPNLQNVFNGISCPISDLIDGAMIELCRSLINGPTKCSEKIIALISTELQGIIKCNNIKNSTTAIELAASFYKQYQLNETTKSLNEAVCSQLQNQLKISNSIISFAFFNSIYKIKDNKLIDLLKKSISDQIMIKKATTFALMVIVCSENHDFLKNEESYFIDSIVKNLGTGDQQLIHRSLFLLKKMLEVKLVEKSVFLNYIEQIYNSGMKTDGKSRVTAIELLSDLADLDIFNFFGEKFLNYLSHEVVPSELLNSCCKLLGNLATNPNNAELIIKSIKNIFELDSTELDDKLLMQIAVLIGSAASSSSEIAKFTIEFFDQNQNPMTMFVMGEVLSATNNPGDPYLVKISSFVDPSLPRKLSYSASCCFGIIASKGEKAFDMILKSPKSFSLLLPAIHGCATRIKNPEKIIQLFDYLLKDREHKKENQLLVAESLSALSEKYHSPVELLSKLVTIVKENSQNSEMAALALSIFCRDEKNSVSIVSIIEDIITLLNSAEPIISTHILTFLKHAFKFDDCRNNIIQNIDLILSCSKFDETKHIVIEDIAFGSVKVDIGKAMRCVAFDAIADMLSLRKVFALENHEEKTVLATINAVCDIDQEVRIKALNLLTKMCFDGRIKHFVAQKAKDAAAAFEKAHPREDESDIGDLEKPLFETIAAISLITRSTAPCNELESERDRYSDIDMMIKVEVDIQSRMMLEEAREKASDKRIDGTEFETILVNFCRDADVLFTK